MPTYDFQCSSCGNITEEFFTIENYSPVIECPKCKHIADRMYTLRMTEPTFTDKIYPFWDRSVNKVFHSPSEKNKYYEANGYREKSESMSAKQERLMYSMKIGNHDPKLRRYSN